MIFQRSRGIVMCFCATWPGFFPLKMYKMHGELLQSPSTIKRRSPSPWSPLYLYRLSGWVAVMNSMELPNESLTLVDLILYAGTSLSSHLLCSFLFRFPRFRNLRFSLMFRLYVVVFLTGGHEEHESSGICHVSCTSLESFPKIL